MFEKRIIAWTHRVLQLKLFPTHDGAWVDVGVDERKSGYPVLKNTEYDKILSVVDVLESCIMQNRATLYDTAFQ